MTKFTKLFILLMLLVNFHSIAQVSDGGSPYSSKVEMAPISSTIDLPKIDMEKVKQEDAKSTFSRAGIANTLNLSMKTSGTWNNLPLGDRLWRLHIKAKNATFLVFTSRDFFIPKGGKLFIYNKNKTQVLGAYTNKSNNSLGSFTSREILGNEMILEYYEPATVRGQGKINVERVYQGYKSYEVPELSKAEENRLYNHIKRFGDAGSCHINANCSEYDKWKNQRASVARISIATTGGFGWCSGALINNTNQDLTPYFLTAWHCQNGATQVYSNWRFDFEFQHPSCSDASSEPSSESVTGCTKLVKSQDSDVLLLKLTSLPDYDNFFLAGWNREDVAPNSSFGFHHPKGDVKKVSTSSSPSTTNSRRLEFTDGDGNVAISIPTGNLWNSIWNQGTTEPGSSGSPLFNSEGLIVGQLTGGSSSCTNLRGANYYGKMAKSWPLVRQYLDPAGTNPLKLVGTNASVQFNKNIRLTSISTTKSPCEFTSNTPINVNVQNFGSDGVTSFNVNYKLTKKSDNSVVSSGSKTVYASLSKSDSKLVTIDVDMSENGEYEFSATTVLSGDENADDNTKTEEFTNKKPTEGVKNVTITGGNVKKKLLIKWEGGNGEKTIILMKENEDFTSDELPRDGLDYPASIIFGAGTQVGDAYVVYNGNESSVEVANLKKGVNYYMAIIENSCSPNIYLLDKVSYNSETITSIESKLSSKIEIYPNPATNFFNIDFNELEFEDAKLSIFTNSGTEIKNTSIKKKNKDCQVDVQKLQPGSYILQIEINGEIVRKRFLKK